MYKLLPDQDETMIAEAVRSFLQSELPIERLRPNAKPVDDAAIWKEMAELGWFGVGLPEAAGGSGMGLVEEILIQRECGRCLVTPTVLGTVLAGHLAWSAGDEKAARAFATGQSAAALAVETRPETEGADRAVILFDWDAARSILYLGENSIGLFEPSSLSDIVPAESIDESLETSVGRLRLGAALHLREESDGPLLLRARLLLAAALVGLAEQALDLAVDYAKLREQFGKPVGTFQAVKHRCADMALRHRLSWYQTCHAALRLQNGTSDAALQVASAKLLAGDAARENGRATIQVHGGLGFQAECDAHWFVKRARVYDQICGNMMALCDAIQSAQDPGW